jgi:protein ImuB
VHRREKLPAVRRRKRIGPAVIAARLSWIEADICGACRFPGAEATHFDVRPIDPPKWQPGFGSLEDEPWSRCFCRPAQCRHPFSWSGTMKRVIYVWLPNWPITRLCLANPDCAAPDRPLAIVAVSGSKRRICAVNRIAHERGVTPGQPLADAKAVAPDLAAVAADREADDAALGALARWAPRFTPSTAPDPARGLWLDVTGCARLWRGERQLVETLIEQLAARGIPCRAAIADTFGAAWAFARRTDRYHILPPGGHRDLLPDLPPGSLRLNAETVAGLRRMGLKTVRQAMRLPRAQLAERFPDLQPRLDQAMGEAAETIAFEHAPSPWFESAAFTGAITTPEGLGRVLDTLTGKLCHRLDEAGQGARCFEATLFGADNSIQRIAIAASQANRDAAELRRLLTAKLESIDPGFGIEVVTLRASRIEATPERRRASDTRDHGLANIAPLIDTLGDRLGFSAFWRYAVSESHPPERSAAAGAGTMAEPKRQVWQNGAARPIRLLSRPEPIDVTASVPDCPPVQFRWRRVLRKVRRAEGPERVAPEWWPEREGRAPRQVRDYYRVEDDSGARYWLYRDGLYSDMERPRWFIHGFLA